MARGTAVTFGGHLASLARPVAIACFARTAGADALGVFVILWTMVEIGARVATLGVDRGMQRWTSDNRARAAVAGLVITGAASLAIAAVLIAILPSIGALDATALFPARVTVGVTLPLIAMGNVALRSARGQAQIATYVLARNVAEPLLLLVAGLVSSSVGNGSVPLLAAYVISIAGGAAIAGRTLVRTFGLDALRLAARTPAAWPMRSLVGSSIPLGVADLLGNAQAKLDVVAVSIITMSATQVTAYAIAAELAAVFSSIRQGFDQVIAPVAAEHRDDHRKLAEILSLGVRWSTFVAVPIAILMLVFPRTLLAVFGGSSSAVPVLVVLVLGRVVDTVLGPAASILAMIGRPRLALLDAAAGMSIAILGQVAFGASGPVWIAVASSLGVVVASVLPVFWLGTLEHVTFKWSPRPRRHGGVTGQLAGLAVRTLGDHLKTGQS